MTDDANVYINFCPFLSVIKKGQVLTHYYRLMNKSGGYTWLQTCATVVCNSKNAEEQNIICVNYVIRCVTKTTIKIISSIARTRKIKYIKLCKLYRDLLSSHRHHDSSPPVLRLLSFPFLDLDLDADLIIQI